MAYTFHGIPLDRIDLNIKTHVSGERIPNGKTLTTTNIKTMIADLNFEQTYLGVAETAIPEWANHISIYAVGGGGGGGGGSGGILFNNAPNNEWKYTTGGSGAGGGAGGTAYVQMVDISSNINTATYGRYITTNIGKGGLGGTGGVMVNHGGNGGDTVYGYSGNDGSFGGMTNVDLLIRYNMVQPQSIHIMSADGGNGGGGGYRSNIYSGVPADTNTIPPFEYRLALPGNQNSPFYGISNALNYGTFDGIPFAVAATRGQQRSEGLVFRPEGGSNNADDVPGGVGAQHGSNNTIFQDPVIVGDGGNGGNSRLASSGRNGDAGRNGYVRIAFFGQAD